MDSHVVTPPTPESEEKLFDPNFRKASYGNNGQASYGLREKPRKTWRASDEKNPPWPLEKICKQCGKGFRSLKALCGHMASHSEKEKAVKNDHSWNSGEEDSHSDTFQASKGKKIKKMGFSSNSPFTSLYNNNNNNNSNVSSSLSEIDCNDHEEVAMCLMMLSRDFGTYMSSVVESSDNNSVILETKSCSVDFSKKIEELKLNKKKCALDDGENSDSGYFLDECAKKSAFFTNCSNFSAEEAISKEFEQEKNGPFIKIESRKKKHVNENREYDEKKRVKYECFNCKRAFKSYQALGGHRPCHKRTNNAFYENSLDDDSDELVKRKKMNEKKGKSKKKKNKGHKCPFCERVFKNGQALGGHKRSHFIGGHVETYNYNNVSEIVEKKKQHFFIDLNLPAPQDDENGED
ncbi:zinc finger family protein [Striga asiatica]|uniref:Zinc finger family protein n=1 Tax=Striga asiatica TaxID=4170 RepID=A0A5A7Q6I4_STRAF|nr:zinc finger family protein [Striga asiatica]